MRKESSRLLEQIIMLSFSNSSGDKSGKENVPHGFKKNNLGQINLITFFDSLAAWQSCIHLVGTSTSSMPLMFSKVSDTNLVISIFFPIDEFFKKQDRYIYFKLLWWRSATIWKTVLKTRCKLFSEKLCEDTIRDLKGAWLSRTLFVRELRICIHIQHQVGRADPDVDQRMGLKLN